MTISIETVQFTLQAELL